jgi:hypothetical protein
VIDSNFAWLQANKGTRYSGGTDPAISCTTGDSFSQTTSRHVWWCFGTTWVDLGFAGGVGGGTWGSITGDITTQPDLMTLFSGKAPIVHGHAQSDVTGLVTTLAAKVNTSLIGQANGIPSLDASGKVPSSQIPAGSGAQWGLITGNATDQVDLMALFAGREPANPNIQAHIASTSNPHSTTKAQIGLGSAAQHWGGVPASNIEDCAGGIDMRVDRPLQGPVGVVLGSVISAYKGFAGHRFIHRTFRSATSNQWVTDGESEIIPRCGPT